MPDRRRLGYLGWILGAVTATVIAISGVVVNASVSPAVTAGVEIDTR
jgi:hypothetical protein